MQPAARRCGRRSGDGHRPVEVIGTRTSAGQPPPGLRVMYLRAPGRAFEIYALGHLMLGGMLVQDAPLRRGELQELAQ